jgi:hypothetical protein
LRIRLLRYFCGNSNRDNRGIPVICDNKMAGMQIREVVTMFHAVGYFNEEDVLLLLLLLSKPLIKFVILFCWILSMLCYLDPELFFLQVSFVRIL